MEINHIDSGNSFFDHEEVREQNSGQEQRISEPDFDPYGFYPDSSF